MTASATTPAAARTAPAGRTQRTQRTRRTPVYLRLLFDKLERTGSGDPEFWSAVRVTLPELSEGDIERLALAAGARAARHLLVITAHAQPCDAQDAQDAGSVGAGDSRGRWTCAG